MEVDDAGMGGGEEEETKRRNRVRAVRWGDSVALETEGGNSYAEHVLAAYLKERLSAATVRRVPH